MKRMLLRALLAVTILAPLVASAELILYKGMRRDTYTGEGHGLALISRMILIVDRETFLAAQLRYASVNGVKHYSVSYWTNIHVVRVEGARGSYTALARPPTQCEIESGATGEGVYCKGPNATLTLNTNSTILFPKVLSDRGNGLFYSQGSGQPILDEGNFQLMFNRPGTIASNQAGETLDAALARLTAYIESLGYTR